AFVDRFRAKATKARQAQSRLKMLAKMEPIAALTVDEVREINFPAPDKLLSPPIIATEAVTVGYDGRAVLSKLTLRIDNDDRIALLGANGNGKSTFVKLIAGRLAPMQGDVTRAANLKVAYFAQHQLDELDPEDSPYDHVRELMPDASESQVRARVGAIGFSGDAGNTPVKSLSGGEKARLLLALATFDAPHLVILDEPTNHLDIDSRAALIEAINDYPGAVILVSHDRYLLEACADRLWLVAGGRVTPFDGDLDDYVTFVLSERGGKTGTDKAAAQSDRAQARKAAADKRAETAPLRKRVQKAEADMARLTKELEKLDATLADGGLFTRDAAKAAMVAKARADAASALAAAEEEWLSASHALESA
ncbi:MAG TPA: ATP-binding cassette domain-containing protein, partial [Pseudolabrys sp.]|nr:ATP-binding cassette domain-containing protein [Pseudolabrys sp.]